jgi:hypothetical protein
MKTFTEAANPILALNINPETNEFYLRYACLFNDVQSCQALAGLIQKYKSEAKLCCADHIMAEIDCAARAFFHLGVAVGIEMTKVDE